MKQDSVAQFVENLCGVSWYTADPEKPWLVKAAAGVDFGYQILITDLESTYFCSVDQEEVKNEKKAGKFKIFNQLQQYNPTIKTDEFKDLINLLHQSICKFDPNTKYSFIKVAYRDSQRLTCIIVDTRSVETQHIEEARNLPFRMALHPCEVRSLISLRHYQRFLSSSTHLHCKCNLRILFKFNFISLWTIGFNFF